MRTRPRPSAKRLSAFIAGAGAVGLGIALLIRADFGVAPLDVLNTGLAARTGLDVGTCSWITAAILMALAFLLGRRIRLGTVVGSFVVGAVINGALAVLPSVNLIGPRIAIAVAGFLCLYLGISFIVNAAIGAGPSEELMLGLVGRGYKMYLSRWGIEAALFLVGFLLGGQVGAATLAFILLTGPALHVLIPLVGRILRLPPLAGGGSPEERGRDDADGSLGLPR